MYWEFKETETLIVLPPSTFNPCTEKHGDQKTRILNNFRTILSTTTTQMKPATVYKDYYQTQTENEPFQTYPQN